MTRILLFILPAFLPIIIFLIWYYKSFKKDVKVHDEQLEKMREYRIYSIMITGILIILILLYHGLSQESMLPPV